MVNYTDHNPIFGYGTSAIYAKLRIVTVSNVTLFACVIANSAGLEVIVCIMTAQIVKMSFIP